MSNKSGAEILKERVARGRRLRDLERKLLAQQADKLRAMGFTVDDPETAARKLKAEKKRAGDFDQALVDAVRREKYSRYEEVLRACAREAVAALGHLREVGDLVSRRSLAARVLVSSAESKLRERRLLGSESQRAVIASYESQVEDWTVYSKMWSYFDTCVESLANLHARMRVVLCPADVDRLFADLLRETNEDELWRDVKKIWRESSPAFNALVEKNRGHDDRRGG